MTLAISFCKRQFVRPIAAAAAGPVQKSQKNLIFVNIPEKPENDHFRKYPPLFGFVPYRTIQLKYIKEKLSNLSRRQMTNTCKNDKPSHLVLVAASISYF